MMMALLALLAVVAAPHAPPPPACSTIVTAAPRRLELDDGRIVSVDFRSFARSGTSILAVGRHAYLFPSSAGPRTPPRAVDSIIGVQLDVTGKVSVVPNPAMPGRAYHPHVTAIPRTSAAWHVMWVTGLDSVSHLPGPAEQVSLWYARYERGAFSRPQRAGAFTGARINPEISSALLERNGELALAFPFTRNLDGGVILLRGRGDAWRADTLHTSYAPHAVRLIHAPGGFIALIAFSEASRGATHDALYVATFDSAWSRPTLLAEDAAHRATTLELAALGEGFVASWNTMRLFDASTSRLHWMRLGLAGQPQSSGLIAFGENTFPYAMIIAGGHALWLYRGDASGASIAVSMLSDNSVTRLSPITAPFRNPVAEPVSLSPTRFLVFTQKLPLSDREPMAASYVTEVEMRCPDRGRR